MPSHPSTSGPDVESPIRSRPPRLARVLVVASVALFTRLIAAGILGSLAHLPRPPVVDAAAPWRDGLAHVPLAEEEVAP